MSALPGQLSRGMPPRDPIVELARAVKDLQQQVDALRAAPQQMIQIAWGSYNGTAPNDGTWRPYATTNTITAPGNGFDRLSWFMWSDAGQTFDTSGLVGAQAWFNAVSGCPLASGGGGSQSNGGQVINASTVLLYTSTGWAAAAGATFNLQTYAYFNGTASTPGTANCQTNAMLIWTKS